MQEASRDMAKERKGEKPDLKTLIGLCLAFKFLTTRGLDNTKKFLSSLH